MKSDGNCSHVDLALKPPYRTASAEYKCHRCNTYMKCTSEPSFLVGHGEIWRNRWIMRLLFHDERPPPASRNFRGGFAKAELRSKDRTIKKVKTSDVSSIMRTSSERDDR